MEEMINVQVEDNSPLIEHILRPISYISWLMGVGVARPRKCPKAITIIIRIAHFVLCSIYAVYETIEVLKDSISSHKFVNMDIFMFMYYMNLIIFYMSAYYHVYHGIRQYDKWPKLMDRIEKLDQKIRREIPLNDQLVKKMVIFAIFMAFVCWPLSLIVHGLYNYFISDLSDYNSNHIFISNLLLHYILAQSLINSFSFNIIVYVLYHRFQTINKLLGQLDELSDASRIALKIRRVRELHHSICDLVNMVNDIYGLQLLLFSTNCISMIALTIFYFFDNTWNLDFFLTHTVEKTQNIFSILYIMQFILMCCICTPACEESQRTATILYKFALNCKNLDKDCVRDEVNDFSIHLQQYQIGFTACDYFKINNALLYGFVQLIFAYIIVLSQIKQIIFSLANISSKI